VTLNVVLRAGSCCAALVGLVAAGACSSSASKASAPTSGSSTTSASSAPQSSSSASLRPADAATTAAVTHAYVTFFNYRTASATAQSLLQDGAAFAAEVVANGKAAQVRKPSVTVSTVQLVSDHTAKVIFTLSVGGSAVLPNTSGYAVLEAGTWKVAGQTFCALIGLNNSHPAICTDPAATALPS